jgi:two-component system response regulator
VRNRNVLLIEDNADDVELILRAIKSYDPTLNVRTIEDGADALDFLFRTGQFHDRDPEMVVNLILLDLRLPRVDGHDILKRLREHPQFRKIPVVVLTGSNETQDMLRTYDLGVNGFVRKTAKGKKFADDVIKTVEYWVGMNISPPVPLDPSRP